MDNQEREISLGQLFTVVKKSLIRGLIYVLVSVIIFSAVLVLIKTIASTNVYKSTITFSTTDSTTLEKMKGYSANAINKALITDKKPIDLSDEVAENLSVSAVIPKDNEKDSSFIPTSFSVSLKSSSKLKLSSGEYKSLVDNIANEFVGKFATNDMPAILKAINVDAQIAGGAEYLQVAYALNNVIEDYLVNLDSFAAANPAAKNFAATESGKTLSAIISDFNFIKSEIDNIKSSIVLNKYGKGNLKNYLSAAQITVEAEAKECQKVYDAAIASINAYKSTVEAITKDDNGNNIYTFDDSAFTKLTEQVTNAAKQLGAAEKKKSEIDKFVDLVGDAIGTQSENVENALKGLGLTVSESVSAYSALSEEFNNNKTIISAAKVSKPAYSSAESIISAKIIVIADIAVALIAYIVAFGQTFAIMKKKGELN